MMTKRITNCIIDMNLITLRKCEEVGTRFEF